MQLQVSKFPLYDVIILAITFTLLGIFIYIQQYRKNKKAIANLSISHGTLKEELVSLYRNKYELGREENPDSIYINSKSVSRSHAYIKKRNGKFYIIDNNSLNGTFLNGEKLPTSVAHRLENNDEIKIGDIKIKFIQVSPLAEKQI
jgi:pSer/pThr/pTyr-binding forkhead associated (FHA) protein